MTETQTEVVRVAGVNKWFNRGKPNELHVLQDVDATVRKGEVLVVIGPSGSGKSTLLRAVNFLAPPDTGSVTFLGETLEARRIGLLNVSARMAYERQLRHVRTQMGMVFQHFNLFPHMTVLANVASAPVRVLRLSRKEARRARRTGARARRTEGSRQVVPRPALGRAEAACRDRARARDAAADDAVRRGRPRRSTPS